MAYKPTREQRFGVTPVGITQATGLRSMANAFANVGKSVRQVSQAKRETDFSNAMLDAELAGISAVTRDKDGNLQPLNNLDWDSGLDYTVDRHYPEIKSSKTKAVDLLNLVIEKQLSLIHI